MGDFEPTHQEPYWDFYSANFLVIALHPKKNISACIGGVGKLG